MHPFSTTWKHQKTVRLPPENIRKPYGFLMFSGVRERVHWERRSVQVSISLRLIIVLPFCSNCGYVVELQLQYLLNSSRFNFVISLSFLLLLLLFLLPNCYVYCNYVSKNIWNTSGCDVLVQLSLHDIIFYWELSKST